jgi:NAD(P)-dependent dehydrogenase (short-subunit alcohol dehydrogenase family)
MINSLNHKTFIVTGASRGIGRALALELVGSGADVVLNARDGALLSDTAGLCESSGQRVRHVAGDIGSAETAQRLVQEATALGRFSGFIHNAGVARPGPFLWELSEEGFQEVIHASLVGAYQLIRFAVPALLSEGTGIAVFVGSSAAEMTLPGLGAYCVAKSAEEHLARQLAAEAPSIISFAYRPGVVDTHMQAQAREASGGAAPLLHREFQGYQKRGELKSPETVARALVHMMTHDPARFHGRVATWRSGES